MRLAIEENQPADDKTTEQNNVDVASITIELADEAISTIRTGSEVKRQLRDVLGLDISVGQERQTIQDIVSAAGSFGELTSSGRSFDSIKSENGDLRGQVAFLTNRLNGRGGRDHPPCWADESGKVEYLFSIDLQSDSVLITPAWPPHRKVDAMALPGIDSALASSKAIDAFADIVQGIFDWSKYHDPECRHYVLLKSSISDAVQSDRARLIVEDFFYKSEVRR